MGTVPFLKGGLSPFYFIFSSNFFSGGAIRRVEDNSFCLAFLRRYIPNMLIKWVKSIVESPSNKAPEPASPTTKKGAIDVAHEVLRREAAEYYADLDGLVKIGWPAVKRRKFKKSVRKKVWDIVRNSFGISEDDMIEEITERITDVAEVDPYYQKMFEKGLKT